MIIHFIGAKSWIEQEADYYRKVIACIKTEGHTLATDWVEETYRLARKGKFEQDLVDWGKVDREDTAAMSKADLVVVEVSKKSFFVGYKVAQAVQMKKPTLALYRNNLFPGASTLQESTDLVYSREYNDSNLQGILNDFFEENTIHTKDMRFNFFINRQIYNYLRWASLKTGKTKAEVLRELVEKEIGK